jgi:hypothetical protein
MSMTSRFQRTIPLVIGALVGFAPVVSAQWNRQVPREGTELFEWRGRVDREVQIYMRGNRVWTQNIGRTEPNNERSRSLGTLPRQQGEVVVRSENGRGSVDVIQQPDASNNFTTVVRIQDPRSGSDTYHLEAYWQGYANGDVYGRGRGRGRDDDMRSRGRDDNNGDWDRNGNRGNGRGDEVMRWSGNVDGELEIRLQNGRVEYRTISGNQPTSIRYNAGNAAGSRTNGQLRVTQNQGRGSVNVIQEPSAWNGYTTVIRVRDPQGGYGFYDFDLYWQ